MTNFILAMTYSRRIPKKHEELTKLTPKQKEDRFLYIN